MYAALREPSALRYDARMRTGLGEVLALCAVTVIPAAYGSTAGITFENPRLRVVLGEDAAWRSLVDKAGGQDQGASNPPVPFATGVFGEAAGRPRAGADFNVMDQQKLMAGGHADAKTRPACKAAREGDRLVIEFDGVSCRLTYRVDTRPDWILFTLESVSGTRPRELTLLQVPVAVTECVGSRLAVGWDERMAVGLTAANLQSYATAKAEDGRTMLRAFTQDEPGPRLEGASVALAAAPPADYRALVQRIAAAYDLPRNEGNGRPSKELPLARESYWFLSFGERDVERVIDCCRRSGFQQVMLTSGAWCRSPGHYDFNLHNYPDGLESLRRTVERLHAENIRVGMHSYASKIAKIDAYVTPVPDRRFWVDRVDALAADVSATCTAIHVRGDLREWPGSPVASQKLWEGGVEKHREVLLDDEIVQYRSIDPDGGWNTFEGCTRGAWGTTSAAHRAGAAARHYGVDGCINGYIIDQDTPLLDEVTTRLAAVFNACGFDMVYFDGGEDVDRRRFVHYVSNFQAAAMRKFHRRPMIHMGTVLTHNLWSSFTRSGTVDTYLNTLHGHIQAGGSIETWPTVRDHIDKSVAYLLSLRADMMPGELGWFGIWPKGDRTEGLQYDDIDYLMLQSLAHDAPVSLQTSFSQMDRHPLTRGLLEIVRVYEQQRKEGTPARETLAPAVAGKHAYFTLLRIDGKWSLVRVGPRLPTGGGAYAQVGDLGTGAGAVALLWRAGEEAVLGLPLPAADLRFENLEGRPLTIGESDGSATLRVGPDRRALFAAGVTAADLSRVLEKAK